MASVAAPIPEPSGPAISAVQVAGTQDDIPAERIEQLGIEVQRAAFAIARRVR